MCISQQVFKHKYQNIIKIDLEKYLIISFKSTSMGVTILRDERRRMQPRMFCSPCLERPNSPL